MLEAQEQKELEEKDIGRSKAVPVEDNDLRGPPIEVQTSEENKPKNHPGGTAGTSTFSSMTNYVTKEINADPYEVLKTDSTINEIHKSLKRHEVRVEELFKYVQVFTAIVASFTHGNVLEELRAVDL